MNKTPTAALPPYPRLGEIYRALALALDTKAKHEKIDRLASEGEFDWSLLPSLGEDLVIAPLAKYIDPDMADLVDKSIRSIHGSYISLVSTVSVDSLTRDEALPLLVENYFSLHAVDLIVGIKKSFGGPNLSQLFDPDLNPVAVVLDWLNQDANQPLAKIAFPGTTGSDRSGREMVRKWEVGTNLPDMASVKRFADTVKTKGVVQEEQIQNLRRWLIVARAIAYLERESPIPFRGIMHRQLLLGMPDFDIVRVLSMAVIEAGERYSVLKMPARILFENLKRTTSKQPGEQAKTKAELEEFEQLSKKLEPEGRTQFHIEWLNGRWLVLSGCFAEALPYYERAADFADYRAGSMQKKIVQEALVLAALLSKKPLLKRLKHRAIVFGLFPDPRSDDVIEDWEINHLVQQFHQVFPELGMFPEALGVVSEKARLPFLLITEQEVAELKPDLRKPDQVKSIGFPDGQVRRWPQLRLFASLGRSEETKALLECGASVDQLDQSGASALLCAVQHATENGDRQVLDLILQHKHERATLDRATTRKQLTPLFCAIDYGDPDVVEKLLEMGATPDRRGNIVDETPLYYAMSTLAAVLHPERFAHTLRQSFISDPDRMQREVNRRHNVVSAGIFGDGGTSSSMLEDPRNRNTLDMSIAEMVQKKIARHSIPKLIRIIELLLEHKANPNAQHCHPEPGRTPLMLAAESNSGWAFDLMMRYGGNPNQPDAAGMNCLKITIGFGATEVYNWLNGERGI